MQYVKIFLLCSLTLFCFSQTALAADWPQWRGPQQNGSSPQTNLPEIKDPNDAVWVTSLPGGGISTPIVWDSYVFTTTADKASKMVVAIALDAGSGRILWKADLGANRVKDGLYDMTAPSPVTDGKYVWFMTGNGQIAAFTTTGKPVWRRDLAKDYGQFEIIFGYTSSPLLYDGKLYLAVLQNEKPGMYGMNVNRKEPLESYLLALNPATGKTLWKQNRDTDALDQSREAYVTPYPYQWQGRKEIILAGGECVTGHDPGSGAELWRWWFTPADRKIYQHNIPTPVAADRLIFVIRPEHRPLFALRPEGKGTLGEKTVAWTSEANRCWIATPVVYQDRLYVLHEQEKAMVCIEPKTGRVVWQHNLPVKEIFQATPTAADGKIYCITVNGEVVVLAAGDEYKLVSTMNLNVKFCRSAIVPAEGKLYIRAGAKLYCFAKH